MTYILYTADPEKGTSTYTQHTFTSLKDLTQWCVAAAFSSSSTPLESLGPPVEEKTAATTSVPCLDLRGTPQEKKDISFEEILSRVEAYIPPKYAAQKEQILTAAKQYIGGHISISSFYANIPCERWESDSFIIIMSTYRTKKCIEQLIPETDTLKELRAQHHPIDRLPVSEKGIIHGISSDNSKASEYIKKTDINQFIVEDLPEDFWSSHNRNNIYDLVRYYSGNWSAEPGFRFASIPENVKKYFVDVFVNDYMNQEGDAKQFIFGTDMTFLLTLYFKHPHLFSGNLAATSGVYWERLPEEFKNEARGFIATQTGALNATEIIPRELFAVYKFLQAGRYLTGWGESLIITLGETVWPSKEAAEEIVLKIADEYGTLTKPSAALREFFVKIYAVQRYTRKAQTTIGSTEFLDVYVEDANAEGLSVEEYDHCFRTLPLSFRTWLATGTTHKDCKAALESLGVQQVRRSEGQRYLNIERVEYEPVELQPVISTTREFGKTMNGSWKLAGELDAFASTGLAGF
jgi:hypothetical protein